MSDVLSRILANALGGAGAAGPQAGTSGGTSGDSPLGVPRMPGQASQQSSFPMPGAGGGGMGGGLGAILGGLLGGLTGGGQAAPAPTEATRRSGPFGGISGLQGAALMALLAYLMRGRGGTAGLSSLTDQFRQAGLGPQIDSWIGPDANQELNPDELARVIPPDAMEEVERQTGLGRDDVLSHLSRGLPRMVDRLTPQGRMPERDDELENLDPGEVMGGFGPMPGADYGKTAPGQGGF